MGSICCSDGYPPPKCNQFPAPSLYKHPNNLLPSKNQQQLKLQEQKKLLEDFFYAVLYLKQSCNQQTQVKFRGIYTHNQISTDRAESFSNGTLVSQDSSLIPCLIKKIRKSQVVDYYYKRSLTIEQMTTSYHVSNFIIKNIAYNEDSSFLYLYFNIGNYNHLSIYTTNNRPEYFQFFRNNLEGNIRFIAAGIISGLNYLHSLNIVYRGINNENIVVLQNGYPLLTNLSKLHPERYQVPIIQNNPFMSPEQFREEAVTHTSDFWSLGVLLYFMWTGTYPNFKTFQENKFDPIGMSHELSNLINRLLIFNPTQRIGFSHADELRTHPFFRDFNWYDYEKRQLVSPFSFSSSHLQIYFQPKRFNQNNFRGNNNRMGLGLMSPTLFVDLPALYLISSAFEANNPTISQQIINMDGEVNFKEDSYSLPNEDNCTVDQMLNRQTTEGRDYD